MWCAAITSGRPFVLAWACNLSPGVEGGRGSGAIISENAVSGREFWFLGWRGDNDTGTIAHLPFAVESFRAGGCPKYSTCRTNEGLNFQLEHRPTFASDNLPSTCIHLGSYIRHAFILLPAPCALRHPHAAEGDLVEHFNHGLSARYCSHFTLRSQPHIHASDLPSDANAKIILNLEASSLSWTSLSSSSSPLYNILAACAYAYTRSSLSSSRTWLQPI